MARNRTNGESSIIFNDEGARAITQPQRKSLQQLQGLIETGQFPQAESDASQLIEKYPGTLKLIAFLGDAQAAQGKFAEAAASYVRAIQIDPGFDKAHIGLGAILMRLNKPNDAAVSYLRALEIRPDCEDALLSFSNSLGYLKQIEISEPLSELLANCLRCPRIESPRLTKLCRTLIALLLGQFFDADANVPGQVTQLDVQTRSLLAAYLESAVSTDPDLEPLLTGLRSAFLHEYKQAIDEGSEPAGALRVVEAIARQSFLNEYVWHITPEESKSVARLKTDIIQTIERGAVPSAHDLCLLAAYQRLYGVGAVRDWALQNPCPADDTLTRMLEFMIANPARESEIEKTIEQLTDIDAAVSQAVRAQYEENPYPRWHAPPASTPVSYTDHILLGIAPNHPKLEPATENPNILIAGCGTGKQPIGAAGRFRNSKVLAVDLSRTSLAYAQRKADELSISNIKFAQADILNLGVLDDRFDLIECSGVLHHMAKPEEGLKVLVSLLKPRGFLKLALYSELGRQNIVEARKLIGDKPVAMSEQGIRDFRFDLKSASPGLHRSLAAFKSFHNISGVRDLVFHIQEHRYSVPQIEALIADHGLEFLGFIFRGRKIKDHFLKAFPDDPGCTDLKNWDRFENDNPDSFSAMYQFWCRKKI